MAIEVKNLHEITSKSFGVSGRHFEELLLSAINDISRDLRADCDMTVTTSGSDGENVERLNDTISLDNKFIKVYKDGIRYYLNRSGEWGREPSGNEMAEYRMAKAQAQRLSFYDEDPDVGFVR